MKEERKDVKWYEWLYIISNTWKVARILKDRLSLWYNQIMLSDEKWVWKQFKVHRLVLENFVWPAPEWFVCNHKDWNRNNNSLENLERCTQKYNVYHAVNVLKSLKPYNRKVYRWGDNIQAKQVYQKDLQGNTVKKRDCIKDIKRELWYDQWNISSACKKWYIRYWYKREFVKHEVE